MNALAAIEKTDDWHAARALGIGGSEAATIMSGDWLPLWELKVGYREPEDLSDKLAVVMGSHTEDLNRAWFIKQTGIPVRVEPDPFVHPEHPFMRANLDGLIEFPERAVFEAKHTGQYTKDDEAVTRYFPQVQHCMAVIGAEVAYLSVFFGNSRWASFTVHADVEYQARLIEREREFWGYVERNEPPPHLEAEQVTIAFDEMREADMTGSNLWADCAATWLQHRDAAKEFARTEKEIKALVEADVRQASGHGIIVKRSKSGALTIKGE
jgi:putative phage-type endonuclease